MKVVKKAIRRLQRKTPFRIEDYPRLLQRAFPRGWKAELLSDDVVSLLMTAVFGRGKITGGLHSSWLRIHHDSTTTIAALRLDFEIRKDGSVWIRSVELAALRE